MNIYQDIEIIRKLPISRYLVIIILALTSLFSRRIFNIFQDLPYIEMLLVIASCIAIARIWVKNGLFILKYFLHDGCGYKNLLSFIGHISVIGFLVRAGFSYLSSSNLKIAALDGLLVLCVVVVFLFLASTMDKIAMTYRKNR